MLVWVFLFVILTLSSGSHCSLPPSLPLRTRRYADAIFTNSYRKVLGQLSARKLLQDIMSRQHGERNQEQGAGVRLGRQVDGVWAEQKQMALESVVVALLQKHRNPEPSELALSSPAETQAAAGLPQMTGEQEFPRMKTPPVA